MPFVIFILRVPNNLSLHEGIWEFIVDIFWLKMNNLLVLSLTSKLAKSYFIRNGYFLKLLKNNYEYCKRTYHVFSCIVH